VGPILTIFGQKQATGLISMQNSKLSCTPICHLLRNGFFFFCMAFISAHLRLKINGALCEKFILTSMCALAIWAAFPAFQELITALHMGICSRKLNGWPPQG